MNENAPAAAAVTTLPSGRTIDTATLAWLRLARVYHKIDRRSSARFRAHGLSVGRFDVLNHAGTPEGRTQQDLAASLLVTKGNITQLLDAMEHDGLIERRREGRSNRIYLTPQGRELRSCVVGLQESALDAEFAPLDEEERRTLLRLLRKLDRGLETPSGVA